MSDFPEQYKNHVHVLFYDPKNFGPNDCEQNYYGYLVPTTLIEQHADIFEQTTSNIWQFKRSPHTSEIVAQQRNLKRIISTKDSGCVLHNLPDGRPAQQTEYFEMTLKYFQFGELHNPPGHSAIMTCGKPLYNKDPHLTLNFSQNFEHGQPIDYKGVHQTIYDSNTGKIARAFNTEKLEVNAQDIVSQINTQLVLTDPYSKTMIPMTCRIIN